jgi:hypothetical protein
MALATEKRVRAVFETNRIANDLGAQFAPGEVADLRESDWKRLNERYPDSRLVEAEAAPTGKSGAKPDSKSEEGEKAK